MAAAGGATSTNPFSDDSEDDSYDEDEMARALEAMDIDTDFNCWTSFRASISVVRSTPDGARDGCGTSDSATPSPPSSNRQIAPRPELTESEKKAADKWSRRVHREEVYSKFYKPVPRESREVQDLAIFLGVSKGGGGRGAGGKRIMDKLNVNQEAGHNGAERSPISKLLFPAGDEPKSVLLKRGPVLLRRGNVRGERELILLSRGFIVAIPVDHQDAPSAPTVNGGLSPQIPAFLRKIPSGLNTKLIRRNFETAEELTTVVAVEDVDLMQQCTEDEENSFAIVTEDDDGTKRRYVFTCAKPQQKEAWLEALAVSVVQVSLHTHIKGGSNNQIGWQHDILRTSIYSAAVRGDDAMMRRLLSKKSSLGSKLASVDALDSYCGYTALHYAAMRNQLTTMEALLQAGASAVAMDKHMKEPIFYAEQFKDGKAIHLLESYGAIRSPPAGEELFSGEIPRNTEAKSHEVQAKGIAGAMSENVAAMRERGERLNALDNKTAQLERNAVDYRDNAKQLKEKAKKQSMFGF